MKLWYTVFLAKSKILKEGDILTIDTVTVLDGYFGDSAITYAVGEIDETSKKIDGSY